MELPDSFSGKYWEPVETPVPKEPVKKAVAKKKSAAKK